MRYDTLTAQTYERLAGVKALFDVLDEALPTSHAREHNALLELANVSDWPPEEFASEERMLDERFQQWLPRYAAYSVIVMLHAVVETQLLACARRAGVDRKSPFKPQDLRGAVIEAAALYLKRVGVLDVAGSDQWVTIRDLRDLRNLIVHRVGTKGSSQEHTSTANRLASKYGHARLEFPNADIESDAQVWLSMYLCRDWMRAVALLFDQVFSAMGLPKLAPGLNTGDAG